VLRRLVLLDRGMSHRQVASVLLIDDNTVRQWRQMFETEGVEGLARFHFGGRQAFLNDEQENALSAWVAATLPRNTREVGGFIEQRFGVSFASRSGLVVLLHRLGFVHRKPMGLSSRMDPQKQIAFLAGDESPLNQLPADEMVMFSGAVPRSMAPARWGAGRRAGGGADDRAGPSEHPRRAGS